MVSIRPREWTSGRGQRRVFVVHWREDGRQKQKQFDRRGEAERFAAGKRAARSGRQSPTARFVTLGQAVEIFRETLDHGRDGAPPVALQTARQYDWAFARYIVPALGDLPLAELSAPLLAAWRDELLRGPLSRKSVSHIVKALKAVLNEAARRGLVVGDTWSTIRVRGVARERRPVIPTRAEATRLLATAERLAQLPTKTGAAWRRYHPLIATALLTGLRQQEIRALAWNQIDFGRGLITVSRAADAWGTIKETKTAAGRRQVELPSQLAQLLKAWRARCETPGEDELVFPRASGGVIDKANLYHRCWLVLCRKAGLGEAGFSFQALRHYYASALIAAGVSPKEVQQALGHANIDVTFDTYAHLFPEDRRERRRRVARIAAGLMRS